MEMGNNVFLSDEQPAPETHGIDKGRLAIILDHLVQLINETKISPVERASGFVPGRLQIAKNLVSDRSKRAHFFDGNFFGEPSWDILLDLYIAGRESRKVTTSEACIASLVPGSTALRIILFLVRSEMITKTSDVHDKRRIYLTLTSTGQEQMENYLDAVNTTSVLFPKTDLAFL